MEPEKGKNGQSWVEYDQSKVLFPYSRSLFEIRKPDYPDENIKGTLTEIISNN